MRQPRTLDDLLDDARAFPDDDFGADEERERRQLEEEFADSVRRGTAWGGYPYPAVLCPPAAAAGRPAPAPRRERAARQLRALSTWTVRGPYAARHIASLATTHQIDTDSSMAFACLLHLAGRDEQAEFLWQFAAGAGKAASAECLYLLYVTRGELRHARHWARQAADLDAGDAEPHRRISSSPPCRDREPLTSLMLLRALRILRQNTHTTGRWTRESFCGRAGTISRSLTVAVQGLTAESSAEADALPWPDLALADQLHECRA
ncbi:hypothetical protein AB0G60_34645 [Streptomyces angustmyceticus]|uniref:Uncharacterized protein n=1 Tax=Streptomyces angustmyceticus TaxID=285578 RepID=A0A5J4LWL8_9ACTN|nr:hypothetical protein [Streptomyces angustmyceticus]UAL70948.1 hypothetical protein K7396_34025 [Streptomyces angustmyceticus]GES34695.1 hypothetical protein San01_71830 [Streptomyces angustmyceticus]